MHVAVLTSRFRQSLIVSFSTASNIGEPPVSAYENQMPTLELGIISPGRPPWDISAGPIHHATTELRCITCSTVEGSITIKSFNMKVCG